jgi:GxxExxY protein
VPPWRSIANSAAASWSLCTKKRSRLNLRQERVPHQREVELPVLYKDQRLNTVYRADFICFDAVVVEIKAIAKLSGAEEAQIINYLKATGYRVGLLPNFGSESLQYEGLVF